MSTFVEIPIDSTQEIFKQVTSLDGVPYVFEFSYSRRSESWFLDLYLQTDTDPEPVSLGMRVTNNYPLLTGCVGDTRPAGDIVPVDYAGGEDAGRLDLGTRVKLLYITE